MPGLVYASGVFLGTEPFEGKVAGNMALIAFGVVVCAMGELALVVKGLVLQLMALVFEVRGGREDEDDEDDVVVIVLILCCDL